MTSNILAYNANWRGVVKGADLSAAERSLRRKTHQTIQKVTSDIERFHFNTAVSALMELLNEMTAFRSAPGGSMKSATSAAVLSEAMESLALLLAPFAPHIADELWERLGKQGTTYEQKWLEYEPALAKAEEVTIVLQVNGKVRDRVQVPIETERAELERMALENDRVRAFLNNRPIKKVIVVPQKLVNVVV